jgi:3-methyladenine DNA glycosylase AlkD
MNVDQVLSRLKSEGTAQNRKTYGRHGIPEPLYGVSYAVLGKLTKQLGTNHELALDLWESGIHDARVLATMIVDPAQLSSTELDQWIKSANNLVLGDAVAKVAASHKSAQKKAEKWIAAKSEKVSTAGWVVLAHLAGSDDSLPDDYFLACLETIVQSIDSAPNYTRHAMNGAVISIGIRNERLRKAAIAAARTIGKVEVDHGQTSCKTPPAEAYIEKTVAYRKQQVAKRAAKVKAK